MSIESPRTEQSTVEPVVICPSCKKEIRLTQSLLRLSWRRLAASMSKNWRKRNLREAAVRR
jgi:hypothetical protein